MIEGKFWKLVIDSGSCENMVSEEVVKKSSLKIEAHPNPYKLAWLKKGGEISVTYRSLVPFSIGSKYKDKAWCDVIAMDACHILLGRPWQFDRHVVHDGKRNTYSFMMNNTKIILIPSKDVSPKPPLTPSRKNLLARNEFMSEALENGVIYILIVKESVTEHDGIPERVRPLLEEYLDVFPKELLEELPPMRNIQHQIDLIPGPSLPNWPHYHMSPQEHEDLRRQVEELLAKRHIRKEKFYGGLNKCSFITDSLLFLGYVVSKDGLSVDESKVEVVRDWKTTTTLSEVRSFHRLVSFYMHFIHNFSTIMSRIMNCMKGKKFTWTPETSTAFEEINVRLTMAPILVLLDFSQPFELHCDASGVGIRAILSQGGRSVAYFNEKLSGSKLNYSTYDVEFYVVLNSLTIGVGRGARDLALSPLFMDTILKHQLI
ncbi:hypothetical protein LIER_22579 [Lithospermum erythrorhizon]|uniref:Reverse transcriptase/retrotransposon-derived protein RNase H-like domain-containing protein n=1 Tax=Lithospermum erythrorhizon TaxID=34254 RepID=A0AAV3QUC7_LITER